MIFEQKIQFINNYISFKLIIACICINYSFSIIFEN